VIGRYMDENVNGPIVRGLRRRGIDVLTAQEDERGEAPDDEILRRATELGRLLFSRDADLLREATACQHSGEHFSGVVYAHQLLVTVGQCIRDLELIASATSLEEHTVRVTYLPL
jgi:hypothetical protein